MYTGAIGDDASRYPNCAIGPVRLRAKHSQRAVPHERRIGTRHASRRKRQERRPCTGPGQPAVDVHSRGADRADAYRPITAPLREPCSRRTCGTILALWSALLFESLAIDDG